MTGGGVSLGVETVLILPWTALGSSCAVAVGAKSSFFCFSGSVSSIDVGLSACVTLRCLLFAPLRGVDNKAVLLWEAVFGLRFVMVESG